MKETVIWKYLLSGSFELYLETPEDFEALDIQMQQGAIYLWARVDPTSKRVRRKFHVIGTGHSIEKNNISYVATVQAGQMVWHVFQENL